MENGIYHQLNSVVLVKQLQNLPGTMVEKQQWETMEVWEVMVKQPRKVEWDTMVQIQQNLQQALNVLPRKF